MYYIWGNLKTYVFYVTRHQEHQTRTKAVTTIRPNVVLTKGYFTTATAIRYGELSIRDSIPKSTLERHKNRKIQVPSCLGLFQPTFDVSMETELVN